MSLVSSRVSLTHRCTIERDANAGTPDSWGTPETPNWQPHLTGLVCRSWTPSGQEMVDATTTVVVDQVRVIVPIGTDVTERDRVADITYRGAVVVAGPSDISAVIRRSDHLELVLVRVSG